VIAPLLIASVLGCLGIDEFFSFEFEGARLHRAGTGVDPTNPGPSETFDDDGFRGQARIAVCFIEKETRFGTLMGWDLSASMGYHAFTDPMPQDMIEPDSGFVMSMQGGVNASFLRWGDKHRPTGRLAALAGAGFDLDAPWLYGGMRLGHTLAEKSTGIELQYLFVPVGLNAAEISEHRAGATLLLDVGKMLRIGLGAEARFGSHLRDGMAPLNQEMVGDHRSFIGTMSLRIHDK
jgi:hypothetical protein